MPLSLDKTPRTHAMTRAAGVRRQGIATYARIFRVTEATAASIYRDCQHWAANELSRAERARLIASMPPHLGTLRIAAVTAVALENGETA
ncbi:hypothetical protein [Streptomyces sp. NPDC059850]|uniref:hypothetical protein n=1 Tax=Streptomyces sp. NPDC059850 TaxID=3346970 RepID=UPI00365AC05A